VWEKEFCSIGYCDLEIGSHTWQQSYGYKLWAQKTATACAGDGLGRAYGSESTELVQSNLLMSA